MLASLLFQFFVTEIAGSVPCLLVAMFLVPTLQRAIVARASLISFSSAAWLLCRCVRRSVRCEGCVMVIRILSSRVTLGVGIVIPGLISNCISFMARYVVVRCQEPYPMPWIPPDCTVVVTGAPC